MPSARPLSRRSSPIRAGFVLAASCLALTMAYGQSWTPTISNTLRYGTGERGGVLAGTSFRYLENITDFRLAPLSGLAIGGRLLFDVPPEVGDRFEGFSRRYIEWNRDGFSVRAGHFPELFGSGLVLNSFEDRGLAFNTWMDGLRGRYSNRRFSVTALAATMRFRDSVTVTRYEDYTLRGASGRIRPLEFLEIGVEYLSTEATIPQFTRTRSIRAHLPGVQVSVSGGPIRASAAFAFKQTTVLEDQSESDGHGIYATVSYAGDGLGITMEYKDYRFDPRNPIERPDETRATRFLPFQNPPIVFREHSYALLTRPLHQIDFNDEVGLQIEAFASLSDRTTLNVNMSLASRHDAYEFQAPTFSFVHRRRPLNWLPSTGRRYSPYWEIFIEAEHFFTDALSVRGALARRGKRFTNEISGAAFDHVLRSTIIPVQVILPLGDAFSLELQSENEWAFDSFLAPDQRSYTQLFTLLLTRSPDLSVSVRYEHTTNTSDPSGRTDWLAGEIGYTFNAVHTATLAYGRERGGLICSNGVCLYQLPYRGIRFTLRNRIG